MRSPLRTSLLVGLALAAIALLAGLAACLAWPRATRQQVAALAGPAPAHSPVRYDPADLAGLPAPVVRYFARVLTPGQRIYRRARIDQTGQMARDRARWMSFTATHVLHAGPPGFVWDARLDMIPLVGVRVRDGYHAGRGAMLVRAAGVVPIVDQNGTLEMAQASLLRWLAEAPWMPTALLPCAGVRWAPVDDSTAVASIADAGVEVRMTVHFAPTGEIARITAMRHRDVGGGRLALTPFEARSWDYARVDGMLVPRAGEAGWRLADGWFPYWRGRMERVEFE
ncbi:MAG TPA: DUF6544 family protein [Gemmatimonadaceae bacterium]|nr:DUF6544 family protein [Gemmatimonadaceae bacterium]